jgi:hypothetical protein
MLALQNFPKVNVVSDVLVTLGKAEATVTDISFSDSTETVLVMDVPPLDVELRSGSITCYGVKSTFSFEIYDETANITCRHAIDQIGCAGSVMGGDILLVSVNFESIVLNHQLSVHVFGIPATVVELVHTTATLVTFTVQIPSAEKQILTTSTSDLVVKNTQVNAQGLTRAATSFTYAVAPTLLSAVLEHDNSGMQLTFDAETDGLRSEMTNYDCSNVFDRSTLAVFGIGYKCFWIDRRTLKVQFGSPSAKVNAFNANTIIQVKPGVIFDLHGLAALVLDTKRMALLQLHPSMEIELHITGPASVGPCDHAIFQASSNFWGILTFEWSSPLCSDDENSGVELCSALASLTSDTLHLQPGILKEAREYRFRVAASSGVGISSGEVEFSVVKAPVPVPLVSMAGRDSFSVTDDILISASVGIPSGPASPLVGICIETCCL